MKVARYIAPNLKELVVNATTHDEDLIDEKHIWEIVKLTCYSHGYMRTCMAIISKRLSKTHDWIMELKSLMFVHRHLVDGHSSFKEEIVFSCKKRFKF